MDIKLEEETVPPPDVSNSKKTQPFSVMGLVVCGTWQCEAAGGAKVSHSWSSSGCAVQRRGKLQFWTTALSILPASMALLMEGFSEELSKSGAPTHLSSGPLLSSAKSSSNAILGYITTNVGCIHLNNKHHFFWFLNSVYIGENDPRVLRSAMLVYAYNLGWAGGTCPLHSSPSLYGGIVQDKHEKSPRLCLTVCIDSVVLPWLTQRGLLCPATAL